MKITRKNLNRLVRDMLLEKSGFIIPMESMLESYTKESDEIEEQDAVPGVMEPLGMGPADKRRKRRKDATEANAEAFGGGSVKEGKSMKITKNQLKRIIKETIGEFRSEEEVLEYIDDIIDSSPPGTFTGWEELAAELERDGMDRRTAERLARQRLKKIWDRQP